MFGFLHVLLSLFQQLFNATLLGVVLGLLAVRSGSILPGILFHILNNGLAVLDRLRWIGRPSQAQGSPTWLYRDPEQGLYHWMDRLSAAIASASSCCWRGSAERHGRAPEAAVERGRLARAVATSSNLSADRSRDRDALPSTRLHR